MPLARWVTTAAVVCALSFSIELAPAHAGTTNNGGGTVTPSQTPSGYDLWLANAYAAAHSRGSSCPWTYVGTVPIPATNETIHDARDPGTGRMVRIFADCNNIIREVLEPTPGELADDLWAHLPIPTPTVDFLPQHDTGATVGVDIWTWITNDHDARVATSTVLGISATVTATVASIETDWGDGTTTTCEGVGIDYHSLSHPLLERDPDPGPKGTCSHKYKTHSGKQPGKKFTVTSTVTWNGTWTGTVGGATYNGTYAPITKTTTNTLKVSAVQSVNS
jgi:hypothetical protein